MALTPLSQEACAWLAAGERGISSDTIFSHLTGVVATRHGHGYPYDPADLKRCRLLLEQVPELRAEFPRMAELGDPWPALVKAWDELCELMDTECPEWRAGRGLARGTYAFMKQLGC